ncbi:MAG: hypothetical protein BAJALOKI2v1_640026 [Promethearchaeota archaeon]|nr:MAG: hypothetical protein BAJALOKI2v1_640026 [Candidatus Lokiarchaeota archaeon]
MIFNIQVKKDTKLRQKIFSRLEKDYSLSKKEYKKIESKLESEDLNENAKEKALVELQDKELLFKKWHTRFENKELLIKKIENLNQLLDNFEIYKKFIEKVGAKGSSISGEVNTKIKGIYREFDFSDKEFKNLLKNSNLQTLLKKISTFLGGWKK